MGWVCAAYVPMRVKEQFIQSNKNNKTNICNLHGSRLLHSKMFYSENVIGHSSAVYLLLCFAIWPTNDKHCNFF